MILKIAGMFRRRFFPNEYEKNAKIWFANDGDFTHRMEYDELNSHSVVFDLGGYKGQWASDIYSKYLSKVYVFEPATKFYQAISNRFKNNDAIKVFDFGLGSKNSTETIYLSADASSIHRKTDKAETITIKQFDTFVAENNIDSIDLLKINIEGGEYDLLEHTIATGYIGKVKNVQVQFHNFVPNAAARMKGIQENLKKTHELTFQYHFIWENWKLK